VKRACFRTGSGQVPSFQASPPFGSFALFLLPHLKIPRSYPFLSPPPKRPSPLGRAPSPIHRRRSSPFLNLGGSSRSTGSLPFFFSSTEVFFFLGPGPGRFGEFFSVPRPRCSLFVAEIRPLPRLRAAQPRLFGFSIFSPLSHETLDPSAPWVFSPRCALS